MNVNFFNIIIRPEIYPKAAIDENAEAAIIEAFNVLLKMRKIEPGTDLSFRFKSGVIYATSRTASIDLEVKRFISNVPWGQYDVPSLMWEEESNFKPQPSLRLWIPKKVSWKEAFERIEELNIDISTSTWIVVKNLKMQRGHAAIILAPEDVYELVSEKPRGTWRLNFGGLDGIKASLQTRTRAEANRMDPVMWNIIQAIKKDYMASLASQQ